MPAHTRLQRAHNQPRLRPPTHTPPPNGGFCTIRRIATACRRRVAPLMAQFPPRTTPATAPTATSDGQPGHAPPRTPATTRLATAHPAASPAAPGHTRSPACPATALRATPRRPTGGFCTIRRIATACRRRVAALMLQFPTHHPSHGPDRHQRRPTRPRPRTSQSPATTGGNFVLHQLFRQREIKPIHFVQTVTN